MKALCQSIGIKCRFFTLFFLVGHSAVGGIELINVQNCICEGIESQPFLLTAEGSAGPFTFEWFGPEDYHSTTQNPSDIDMPGTYTMFVTNAYGCVLALSGTLESCTGIQDLNFDIQPACDGSDGMISATVTGGEGTLTYLWSNGETTTMINGLSPGGFQLTVTDESGCSITGQATVEDAYNPTAAVTPSLAVDCICSGGVPVSAFELALTNIDAPYTVLWTGPGGFTSMQEDPQVNEAGSYTVSVTDTYGCGYSAEIELPACSGTMSISFSNVIGSCLGGQDGSATGAATGGLPPYTLAWSNGAAGPDLTGVDPGTYTLRVTDSKGCIDEAEVVIPQEGGPQVIGHNGQQNDCGGTGSGSLSVLGYNGTPPYAFAWSNGATGADISGLYSGTYTVTVTDAAGCRGEAYFIILDQELPQISATIQSSPCGQNSGSISIDVAPAGLYNVTWSNGQSGYDLTTIDNLAPGEYCVGVSVPGGCMAEACYTVPELETTPAYWDGVALGTITGTAQGQCAGSIELLLNGSSGPYEVVVSNFFGQDVSILEHRSGTVLLDGLCVNRNYTITITDANGCSTAFQSSIGTCTPDLIITDLQRPGVIGQPDLANGGITVALADDNGNATFSWDNGVNGPTITNLAAGEYTVSVTDPDGCSGSVLIDLQACYTGIYHPGDGGEPFLVGHEWHYEEFDLRLEGGLVFDSENNVTVVAMIREESENEFSPVDPNQYVIEWRVNTQHFADGVATIEVPVSGQLTNVKVYVSNGCVEREVELDILTPCQEAYSDSELSNFFIREVREPCAELDDGTFEVLVPDLSGQDVTLTIGGLGTVHYPAQSGTLSHRVNNLAAGVYPITIEIGTCQIDFSFFLPQGAPELLLAETSVSEETCTYERWCGSSIFLGEEIHAANRNYADGRDFPCRVPLYCESPLEPFGMLDLDRLRLRGPEALEFLHALSIANMESDFPSLVISEHINTLTTEPNLECRRVRICPANMNITYHGWGGSYGGSMPVSDNCNHVFCGSILGFSQDYTLCAGTGQTIFNQTFPDAPPTHFHCYDIRTVNMYALQEKRKADTDLSYFPPEFWGSELDSVLIHFENDERLPCAQVTFCMDDFSVYHHTVESVQCGSIPGGYEYLTTLNTPEGVQVNVTVTINEYCDIIDLLENGSSIATFCRGNDNLQLLVTLGDPLEYNPIAIVADPDTYYLNGGLAYERLKGFAYYENQGISIPKGLVVDSIGTTDFYDFTHAGGPVHKLHDIKSLEHFIDNWDTDQSAYITKTEAGRYLLEYQDSLATWSEDLGPADSMTITDLFLENDELLVVGHARNSVSVGPSVVLDNPSGQPQLFTLNFDTGGQLTASEQITDIDPERIFVNRIDGETRILIQNTGNGTRLNGAYDLSGQAGNWIDLRLSNAYPQGYSENGSFGFPLTQSIARQSVSRNGKAAAFLTDRGSQAFSFDVLQIGESGSPAFSSVAVTAGQQRLFASDSTGAVVWEKAVTAGPNADDPTILLAHDEQGELYLCASFADTLMIDTLSFVSSGGSDILVVKINESGDLLWTQQYGTSDEESVTELFGANGGVYLGGTFSGAERVREIGDYRFINNTDESSKVFISFLRDSVPNPALRRAETEFLEEEEKQRTAERDVEVYPNPFWDRLFVSLPSEAEESVQLQLFDPMGRELMHTQRLINEGENRFELTLPSTITQTDAQIYILRVTSGQENLNRNIKLIRQAAGN